MADFDGRSIIDVLVQHEVTFVLIGGFAAATYGSPFPTNDVDIVPKNDPENLSRLSAALTEMDAKVRAAGVEPVPFSHDAESLAAARIWNLTTKFGDFDITFVPAGTQGYEDLKRDATALSLGGNKVFVASLADIVRSKAAAGRDKDRRVLPVLRELLAREKRPRKKPTKR